MTRPRVQTALRNRRVACRDGEAGLVTHAACYLVALGRSLAGLLKQEPQLHVYILIHTLTDLYIHIHAYIHTYTLQHSNMSSADRNASSLWLALSQLASNLESHKSDMLEALTDVHYRLNNCQCMGC